MKKSHGFVALEAFLILVIVGSLGLIGWRVWRSHHASSKVNSSDKNTAANLASTAKIDPHDPSATYKVTSSKCNPGKWNELMQTDKTYLNIQEWGVRGSYPKICNLRYKTLSDGKTIQITSTLMDIVAQPGCSYAGSIQRLKPNDEVSSSSYPGSGTSNVRSAAEVSTIHIGGYYYLFENNSDLGTTAKGCTYSNAGDLAAGNTNEIISGLLKNLEAIPR